MDKVTKSVRKPPAKGGSRKGVPNKTTSRAREAIALLAESNVDRLQEWLDDIASDDKQGPAVAFRLFMDVLEYNIPKLARVEHSGDKDAPVKVEFSWKK